MIRPELALERLQLLEREGKVGCRHGDDGAELERMDYLCLNNRAGRLTFFTRISRFSPDGSGRRG